VLPYIYQGGVEQYGWLSSVQMMDGLALGETTPGPIKRDNLNLACSGTGVLSSISAGP
jgi:chromate transport protein ChrA